MYLNCLQELGCKVIYTTFANPRLVIRRKGTRLYVNKNETHGMVERVAKRVLKECILIMECFEAEEAGIA